MSYQSTVQSWDNFYLVAGAAAASLVGLLFVSLSLHLRALLARPDVRALARVTLANFALVLLVALVVVIPQDAHAAGLELQGVGAISALIIGGSLVAAIRRRTRTMRRLVLLMRLAFAVVSYAATVTAGVLLTTDSYRAAFAFLAAATLILLVTSLRNTWDLIVSVGVAVLEEESHKRQATN